MDVILGPDSYRRIPQIIKHREGEANHFVDTRLSKFEVYDDLFPSRREGVNAWISIMRGCDKFCTFVSYHLLVVEKEADLLKVL